MAEKAKARPLHTVSLKREQAVYEANLPKWLCEHEGSHVLIKGRDVVGFYETRDDALAAGYAKFGVVPLFVKPIAVSEPVYNIPNALFYNSPPAGTIHLRWPGSKSAFRRVNLHDVRLAFAGVPVPPARAAWVEVEAVAAVPADPGVLALVGPDMLAYCQFFYDGPKEELRLAY